MGLPSPRYSPSPSGAPRRAVAWPTVHHAADRRLDSSGRPVTGAGQDSERVRRLEHPHEEPVDRLVLPLLLLEAVKPSPQAIVHHGGTVRMKSAKDLATRGGASPGPPRSRVLTCESETEDTQHAVEELKPRVRVPDHGTLLCTRIERRPARADQLTPVGAMTNSRRRRLTFHDFGLAGCWSPKGMRRPWWNSANSRLLAPALFPGSAKGRGPGRCCRRALLLRPEAVCLGIMFHLVEEWAGPRRDRGGVRRMVRIRSAACGRRSAPAPGAP